MLWWLNLAETESNRCAPAMFGELLHESAITPLAAPYQNVAAYLTRNKIVSDQDAPTPSSCARRHDLPGRAAWPRTKHACSRESDNAVGWFA
jgi:hypothetical protein